MEETLAGEDLWSMQMGDEDLDHLFFACSYTFRIWTPAIEYAQSDFGI